MLKVAETGSHGAGEKGALERLMGSFSTPKIIDFMSTFREFDYSVNEIAENSGISTKTVRREIPKLCYYEILLQSRTIGKTKMYKFNTESRIAQALNYLISEIATYEIENIIEEEHLETAQNPRRIPRSYHSRETEPKGRERRSQLKVI